MREFKMIQDGVEEIIEATDMDAACDQAREWGAEGDYSAAFDEADPPSTIWVDVLVIAVDDEDERETVTVAIDPPEPDCIDDDGHDWQSPYEVVGGCRENPGVFGSGGGVTITECCMRCGCRRFTDTWAQRPDTGEQGLRSVQYEPGYCSDDLSTIRRRELLADEPDLYGGSDEYSETVETALRQWREWAEEHADDLEEAAALREFGPQDVRVIVEAIESSHPWTCWPSSVLEHARQRREAVGQ